MKARTVTLLAVAAGAMAALVLLSQRREAPVQAPVRLLFDVETDRISRVTIFEGETRVAARRKGREWIQEFPVSGPTDSGLWNDRCRALARLEYDRSFKVPPESLRAYGLDPPVSVAVFELDSGRVFKAEFGKESQAGPRSFARVPDDPRVFVVFRAARDHFRIKIDRDFIGGKK